MIEKAYLITGYQGRDESVKMYLVFAATDFVCLQLQWLFQWRTKGRLLYTDENTLDRENEDSSVTEGHRGIIGANFPVSFSKIKIIMYKN